MLANASAVARATTSSMTTSNKGMIIYLFNKDTCL
jgi:hypothetical protein